MNVSQALGSFRLLQCLIVACVASGCLSPSYQLTPAEVHRLSTIAPEQRGQRVRLTQQTKVGDDRKTTDDEPPPTGLDPQPAWLVASYADHDGSGSHRHRHIHGPGFQLESSSSDEDSRSNDNDSDDSAAVVVVAVVAVAAVAGGAIIAAGAIEGSRFDGYANLAPDHPVLLIHHTGEQAWKPLYELTASDANVSRAVVSRHDGWIDEQERAPLDRVGVAAQFEAGAAQLMTPYGASDRGFSMRAALGYSPWQKVGIFWGGQFVTGDTTQALNTTAFALNLRTFAQLEYWPLALNRLHIGVYGEGGIGQYMLDESTGTRSLVSASVGAGVGLQLDITTRLALTLRAGAMLWPQSDVTLRNSLTPAVTLGAAVY